jgi:alkylhydroperoxidase family enzyme
MARIPAINLGNASAEQIELYNKIVAEHGVVTNMKATLLHSSAALHAVLEWYTLFAKVKPVIGERRAVLFCDAISRENRCTLCATFMRRAHVQRGDNPEALELDEQDKVLIEFGRQLAADPNRVRDRLFAKLQEYLTPAQIVDLTVFGALMIVNNIFNGALQVDLDSSLDSFVIQPELAFAESWFPATEGSRHD